MQTLIRRRVLRRLIWVYTVCLCPINSTLGMKGLNKENCKLYELQVFKLLLILWSFLPLSKGKHGNIVLFSDHCFENRTLYLNDKFANITSLWQKKREPPHDKTNKMTCASSKESDQSVGMPRLIRVFAGRTGHFVGFVVLRLMLL